MNRDPVFDIMKGLGIIAVIVGHCPIPESLCKYIFIWHMPLFFLISGYFYKVKENKVILQGIAKSLLIPYYVTSILIVSISGISYFICKSGGVRNYFLGMIFGSGSFHNPFYIGGQWSIGAIWFLLALAWCRIIFNMLFRCNAFKIKPYYLGFVVFALSFTASYIGNHIYIPTDFLQGLSALVFYYVGFLIKRNNMLHLLNKKVFPFFILGALFCLIGMELNVMGMVDNKYQIWPLHVIAAMGGGFCYISLPFIFQLADCFFSKRCASYLQISGV